MAAGNFSFSNAALPRTLPFFSGKNNPLCPPPFGSLLYSVGRASTTKSDGCPRTPRRSAFSDLFRSFPRQTPPSPSVSLKVLKLATTFRWNEHRPRPPQPQKINRAPFGEYPLPFPTPPFFFSLGSSVVLLVCDVSGLTLFGMSASSGVDVGPPHFPPSFSFRLLTPCVSSFSVFWVAAHPGLILSLPSYRTEFEPDLFDFSQSCATCCRRESNLEWYVILPSFEAFFRRCVREFQVFFLPFIFPPREVCWSPCIFPRERGFLVRHTGFPCTLPPLLLSVCFEPIFIVRCLRFCAFFL